MKEPLYIGFGKHKELTVWQCPEGFLRWLVKQEARTEHFRELQAEAHNALACADDGEQQHYANDMRWDGQ